MFYKSILLALALCICTSVIAHPVQQGKRTIKLSKSSNMTTSDGSFDFEKARRSAERTKAKHQQNEMNRQRNAQRNTTSDITTNTNGANIKIKHSSNPSTLHARQSSTATVLGIAEIGTPPLQFTLLIDTGTADTWVQSVDCIDENCDSKTKYDITKSSSAVKRSGSFQVINNFDGGSASGPVVTDNIFSGGITVFGAYFSPVIDISESFSVSQSGFDGVLGLAFTSISVIGHTSFFDHAVQQGAVPMAKFSLALGPNPKLTFGGEDTSLFKEPIEFHKVLDTGYWEVGGMAVFVGSDALVSGVSAVIDTGAPFIYGPDAQVQKVYAAIPGSSSLGGGFFSYPCSSTPSISFNFDGKTKWRINDSTSFNLGPVSPGSSQCTGAIASADDLTFGGKQGWLLGEVFLENVYTVFKADTKDVGFAPLV